MRMIKYTKAILARLDASKQVSKLSFSEEELSEALNTIDAFNTLDEYSYAINQCPLDKYRIPDAFKWAVFPSAVKDDVSNAMSLNLRSCEGGFTDVMSPEDFELFWLKVLIAYKVNNPTFVGLVDARQPVSIAGVEDMMSVNGRVHYADVPFWPMPMIPGKQRKRDIYYNSTVDDVCNDFIRLVMISKIKG